MVERAMWRATKSWMRRARLVKMMEASRRMRAALNLSQSPTTVADRSKRGTAECQLTWHALRVWCAGVGGERSYDLYVCLLTFEVRQLVDQLYSAVTIDVSAAAQRAGTVTQLQRTQRQTRAWVTCSAV